MRDLYRMLLPILLVLNVSAYCVFRADCNNHGDCLNGMCQCDKGWSGTQCKTSLCQLQCQHGSKPDTTAAECTKCVDCWPGWQGQLCDTWSDNAANISDMTTQLNSFYNTSLSEYTALFDQPEQPIPGEFGLGIDAVTGKYKSLPVFSLDFSNPNKTYINSKGKVYRLPVGVKFQTIPGGISSYVDTTHPFRNIRTYSQYLDKNKQNSTGEPALDLEVSNVYSSRFNLGCNAYSVSHRNWELYSLEITDVSALKLNKYVVQALDYLPPTYDTDTTRGLWDTFLRQYGTGVNQQVKVGGMAVVEAVIKDSIFSFDQFNWESELAYDLDCQLEGTECQKLNPFYKATRSLQPTTFYGGDPSETQNLENWRQTIEKAPAQLYYEYADFSSLIEDTNKRQIHQMVVTNYVNNHFEQMQSDLKAKAKPHFCNIEVVSKQSTGNSFAACPAGDHVLSCAMDLPSRSGSYEQFPYWIPSSKDGYAGCSCYDYFGGICYAVCGQLANPDLSTNTPELHQVQKTNRGRAECSSGWVATGCGFSQLNGTGGGWEKYPAMVPGDNNCYCYDAFNFDCYAMCMPSFASPGHRIIRYGNTAPCLPYERVGGCGFDSDPSKPIELYKGFHPTQTTCECYDYWGGSCYAVCLNGF